MEDELRQSETKLRLIAETIEDLVWICPPDYSKIIYLSPSYEKLWGRTRQSAYDDPLSFMESIHPEDRDRVRALLQEHGSEHRDHEYRIVRPDGNVRWIHDRAFPVRDKTGNVQLMTGVSRDITDWKLAQERLRESEEKFAKVFRCAPIPMTLSSADDGTFVDANDKFCEISGFSLPQCIGRTSVDVGWLLPEERNRLIQEIRTYGTVKDMDLKAQTRDKRELELIYCGELLQTGEHQLILSTAMDVTERKQLEAKNLLLAAIVDSSDDAIIGKTPDGIITSWNKGAEKLYGYPEHEMIGKPITILAPHGREDEMQRILEQIRNGKSVNHIETVRRNRAGEIIPVSLTVSPIIDKDGTIIGASTITCDISDRVKGEEQRDLLQKQLYQAQKMEAVGTLAGGIAHDFNNILQVVRGFSDIGLLDSSTSDTNRDRFRKINEAAQRAADLVRGLMMFSRKSKYNPQPLDMNQHINYLRNMLERTIPKDINIELILEEKLPVIHADPTGVDQVLMNLAVNARDAMPYGGNLTFKTANVTLDAPVADEHVHVKPGHYVLLTVSDTGVGMDRATMEHISEPFFTTKTVGKGTGLGLAVIHGIVNQHQGHILCESEPGKGTRFKIYFPISEFERRSIEPAADEEPFSGGTETILVVDDEEIVREIMVGMLTNAGYKVIEARDGKEALEIYLSRHNEIDLVLLDLMMPVMGGPECLRGLLKIKQSAKVIIESGFIVDGPMAETMAMGAKGSIKKPFSRIETLKVVREVLNAE